MESEARTGATGGGVSQYFSEPDYQKETLPTQDQTLLKGFRGLPDIAYNANPQTSILIYLSFLGAGQAGYFSIGGTSAAAPQWAGHPLGFLNKALYKLGTSSEAKNSFHDITLGDNSQMGVPGYQAGPGWDPCTGWGTPRGKVFLENLLDLKLT